MSEAWVLVGVALCVLLLGAVFFGAPYVPTRRKDVERLFEADIVHEGDVLVDLGSGDGVLLKVAAEHGIKAYGIELSPILVFISWLRLRKLRKLVRVRIGNYWHQELPGDTTVVFVFLAETYMKKLRAYMEKEAVRLGRPLKLVSYGFEVPGLTPIRTERALLVYEIKP